MSNIVISPIAPVFFSKDFISLFLERGEWREKGRERNINVWLPLTCPSTRDLARNPRMCPDWESKWRPFGSQDGTQSTEPHQPGSLLLFYSTYTNNNFYGGGVPGIKENETVTQQMKTQTDRDVSNGT